MNSSPISFFAHSPFKPIFSDIPSSCVGFVYAIQSLRQPDKFHIGYIDFVLKCFTDVKEVRVSSFFTGHCDNLYKEVRKHNKGFGAQVTRPPSLRPWLVLCYIVGFKETSVNPGLATRASFAREWTACLGVLPEQLFDASRDSLLSTAEGML